MIGEVILAIKALDSAFEMVQGAIAKKKDVEDMAGEVGKFFTAKKKVEEHIKKAREAGTDDLMTGSALEEAITIDQQEERIERMMSKCSAHYQRKGATHRWIKIKIEAAKIERKREEKRKKDAQMKKESKKRDEILIEQLAKTFLAVIGAVLAIATAVFFIFGTGVE